MKQKQRGNHSQVRHKDKRNQSIIIDNGQEKSCLLFMDSSRFGIVLTEMIRG